MAELLESRREFSASLAALIPVLAMMRPVRRSVRAGIREAPDDGISRTEEAIHQEVVFKASRERVYEALMDARRFHNVTGGEPTEISGEAGAAFSLFGARVRGRNVELLPDERIVQAWRSEAWKQGTYSIARFELVEWSTGTKLVFDHTGFPKGQAESLAAGWRAHYWEPLKKYLA
jgi:activator of HSP90 ATPase